MSDYGHDLIFGTFITPQNQRPQNVVGLARLSEQVGLDLVTFQDHPYHPAFLDSWTLMSYVAAQTERVRLSGYVLNLPLRSPAVLARAAASLDLLSSGRVELGIGPGDTFTVDAVEAMGGPRRTAGKSLEALSEAIDIMRGIWDVSAPGGVHVDGEHYHVRGAMRGPKPAHDISIWVPAGGPRGRRLVGRKADGWIAGGIMMTDIEGELALGNRIIDEAATAAGRDPRQIRRLFDYHGIFGSAHRGFLQGPPQQWVEELLPLAIEHGVSAFILVGDDPRAIERWGREVTPALREAVAHERGNSDVGKSSA